MAIRPEFAEALSGRGEALRNLKRPVEALASFDQAIALAPDHPYAFSGLADCAIKLCDWKRSQEILRELSAHIEERKSIIKPFTLLGYCDDPSLHLACARTFTQDRITTPPQPLWKGTIWRHDRIRIAYLSADFRRHAMAYLTAELFELHDRTRFEVMGVSFGVDDKSDLRKRLVKSFDQFYDDGPYQILDSNDGGRLR